MIKRALSATFFITLLSLSGYSYAQQVNQVPAECQPVYGDYWQSQKWGWYGARRPVKTPVEAKEILEKFFIHHKRDVKVVRITEKPHFFVAEMINKKGVIVDLILIDKRTGRMRSMF
jgi:hypothetical protein